MYGGKGEFSIETSVVVGISFNVLNIEKCYLSFSYNHLRLWKPLSSQRLHKVVGGGAVGFGPGTLTYQHLMMSTSICYFVRKGKLSLRRMEKLPKIPLTLLPCCSLLGVSAGLKPIRRHLPGIY